MIALYLKDYLLLGFLLLAEIAVMFYLLSNRGALFRDRRLVLGNAPVSRVSRVTLGILMVLGAAVGYQHITGLIVSQENLIAAIGSADTPGALLVSVSTLKLFGLLLPGVFGAAGIGLAVTNPS